MTHNAPATSRSSTTSYLTRSVGGISYATSPSGNVVYISNSQIPKLSHHAAAATSDGIIFVFGGRLAANSDDESTIERSNRLYAVHLGYASVPAWWQISAEEGSAVPPAREMHGMAAVGNHLYISGGIGGSSVSGKFLGDVWKHKVVRKANANGDTDGQVQGVAFVGNWVPWAGAALPVKISQHQMVGTPDGKLWIFGGSKAGGKVLDRLMSLDTKNEGATWTIHTWSLEDLASHTAGNQSNATSPLPSARAQHGMVAVGYRIYVSARFFDACL